MSRSISLLFLLSMGLGGGVMVGCAAMDSFFGVQQDQDGDGVPETDGSGGVGGTLGSLGSSLPGLLGLGGTILGAFATTYQRIRAQKYLAAARSTVRGIDRALDQGEKAKVSKQELYNALLSERSIDKYSKFIKDLIGSFKKERREE